VTATPPEAGICIMTETYHPVTGGGETQARALARGLGASGVPVHMITRRSDRKLPAQEIVDGVPVYRMRPSGSGHLRKWGMVFTAFAQLVRLRTEYGVILVCGFRALGISAVLAGMLLRKPCVLKSDSQGELSGAFFDPGLAGLHLRHDRLPVSMAVRARNALLRRAQRFVAISSVIETEYLRNGVAAERVVRIPNSVDPAVFCPVSGTGKAALRERLGMTTHDPVAVYTGRLVTGKGLQSLLRAWQEVAPAHPGALLVLVGSGGLAMQNCEDELRRFARENGLTRSVMFTGSVDSVHEYLQAADAFVFPTEREAFGISVIEAMACGLPVVTTAVDGVRDVVRPGVDALVVPPGDDQALAAAIRRAFEAAGDRSTMGAAARQRVLERYAADRVVAAYRELLAGVRR